MDKMMVYKYDCCRKIASENGMMMHENYYAPRVQ